MADRESRLGPGYVATSSGPPTPELVIARLLTAMLWIAVVLAVGGGVWFLMTNGGQQVSYGSLAPPRPELTSPAAIASRKLRNSRRDTGTPSSRKVWKNGRNIPYPRIMRSR